jgi:F-type H+-transporting ATPase subunit epsilon
MATPKSIRMTVITPEQLVLEETATSVVIPAHDGELGVLHNRAPLMCELGVGQLRYTAADRTRRMFIDGGFAQVYENQVTVLTSRALFPEAITQEIVEEASRAAAERREADDDSVAEAERARRRWTTLLSLKPPAV